jgi:hypothetical protein
VPVFLDYSKDLRPELKITAFCGVKPLFFEIAHKLVKVSARLNIILTNVLLVFVLF